MIYELLVRDFSEEQSFKEVLDRLDYLEQLGITAVQFMPPQEYEGNNSWGCNQVAMERWISTTAVKRCLRP